MASAIQGLERPTLERNMSSNGHSEARDIVYSTLMKAGNSSQGYGCLNFGMTTKRLRNKSSVFLFPLTMATEWAALNPPVDLSDDTKL